MANSYISYYDKIYLDKRKILRQYSIKDEIREFVDIIANKIGQNLINRGYLNTFKFINNSDIYRWIKSFLIEGYLSFEIIYDLKQKNIVRLLQLDPSNFIVEGKSKEEKKNVKRNAVIDSMLNNQDHVMVPIDNDDEDLNWIYFPNDPQMRRVLSNSQIIYISYVQTTHENIISYVEEIIPSYIRYKLMEDKLLSDHIQKENKEGWVNEFINIILKNDNELPSTIKDVNYFRNRFLFNSKIPKSILENEQFETTDVRFNGFIENKTNIFVNDMFNKLLNIKKKLEK